MELVSNATVNRIFLSEGATPIPTVWDVFYQRFPESDGLFAISRVGIDSKGTVAIIYLVSIMVICPEGQNMGAQTRGREVDSDTRKESA